MKNIVTIKENELKRVISKIIKESLEEVNYRFNQGSSNPSLNWRSTKRPVWLEKACKELGYKNANEYLKLKRLGELSQHQIYMVEKLAETYK